MTTSLDLLRRRPGRPLAPVLLLVLSALALSFLGATIPAGVSTAEAAGPGQYSAPDWWPLRGSTRVGCARNSPGAICGGDYHPFWAIDFDASEGQPIYAAGAGLAKVSSNTTACTGYGRSVEISHGGASRSLYGHMSRFSDALNASPSGVWVDENTIIGYVGHTGNVSNCSFAHLHYEETVGGFGSGAGDPGGMKACVGPTLVSYPGQWGRGSWNGLPGQTFSGRHDGTGCQGGVRPDGALIRHGNEVYRIVGGAPLWISRCNYTSDCAGLVQVDTLAGYAEVPRDGALARNVDDGAVYRFAGGAPLWITSCDYAPGCDGVVEVDSHAFNVNNHMRAVPADGTLVANRSDGGIYRFAGGAPLWISSCDYAPGCGGSITAVDGGTFSQNGSPNGSKRMRPVPADGTLVSNHADGGIYRVAGGAPLWISSCDYAPGCGGSVTAVDGGTFARNGVVSGTGRLRAYPADNTLVANRSDGGIYRFAGGAPLWITSCEYAPGCGGSIVNVDGGTFARKGVVSGAGRMLAYPADGTFLKVGATPAIRRVAGGAALTVTDCVPLDGACGAPVAIDAGTLEHLGRGFLRREPADGTLLLGKPSGQSWRLTGGHRSTQPGGAGIQINDATIATFSLPPAPAVSGAGEAAPLVGPPDLTPQAGLATTPLSPASLPGDAVPAAVAAARCSPKKASVARGRALKLVCSAVEGKIRVRWRRAGRAKPAKTATKTVRAGIVTYSTSGLRPGKYSVLAEQGALTLFDGSIRVR